MKFNIDSKIFEEYPNFKLGLILVKDFNNAKRVSAIDSLLRGVTAQRGKEFKDKTPESDTMISIWDRAYESFDIDPKRHFPPHKKLLQDAKNGEETVLGNSLVNMVRYFSLKFLLPAHMEDLDWLCGDLNLTITLGNEPFRPANSIQAEKTLINEVAYMDDGGITCRNWNSSECERTKITQKTLNATLFVEDLSKMPPDEFWKKLGEMESAIRKYIGGEITKHVLNKEHPSLDLGIEGRKNIDDSKISAQEKAYFLAQQRKIIEAEHAEKESLAPMQIYNRPIAPKKNKDTTKLNIIEPDSYHEKIKLAVEKSIIKSFAQAPDIQVKIDYPPATEHGEYACNTALLLAKILNIPAMEIAETLKNNIKDEDYLEKVEVMTPGFLNFRIAEKSLLEDLSEVKEKGENYGKSRAGGGKSIILDYSSPNIAKPLGVHHLLSTLIGQALANILTQVGFKTIAINHLGDWGTQFGKLIGAYKLWGNKKSIEQNPVSELLKLYVKFHDEAEKNAELEEMAREEFKKLENYDRENRKIWEWIIEESLKDLQKTYDKIGGIHFDYEQGESFYEDKLEDILSEGKQRSIFVEGDEGSFIVKYDDPDIAPFVVQKKDSATLYSTRDFAALKYRISEWHPVKILYIVDSAQTMHFKQLFSGAERFPWYHGEGVHIKFGRMRMPDKKMSTRKGNIVLLDDLLDEALDRTKKIVQEKNSELENIDEVSKKIAVAAIKYSILSQNRTTDIVFDWDKMLSLEGNSALYLMYTYARAKSILRKNDQPGKLKEAKELGKTQENENKASEENEQETGEDTKNTDPNAKVESLLRCLPKFKEAVLNSAREYKPNILCNYLFDLSGQFNSFYNSVPVLKANDEDKELRLKIVEAVSVILENGLRNLGIEVVEEL